MSHAAVIINTPSQLGRHSPSGQVSYESTLNYILVVVINMYPSLSQFGEGVYKLFMCRKVQHVYFFPLHHVSENDILSQPVSIYHETQVSNRASHNSGYNHRIHLMIK